MISSGLVTCPVAQEVFAGAPMIIARIFYRNGGKYWASCTTSLGSLQQGYQGHNLDRARKYNRNLQLWISSWEESEYINVIIKKWNHKVKQYHPWFTTNANALRQEQYLFTWDSCFQLTYKLHMIPCSDLMNRKLYLVPIRQQQLVIFTWIWTKLVRVSRWLPHTKERRTGPSTITII